MISCICPVYNSSGYLNQCINSVLLQTYSDLELLLIDDGSTDDSGEICKDFVQKDQRIKYFRKENGGAASARNKGLDIARGEYIAFIDSDDWYETNYLEKMLQVANSTGADVIVSSIGAGYASKGKLLPNGVFSKSEYIIKAVKEFEYISVFSLCTKLVSKNLIDRKKIRMPEEYRLSEDQLFNIALMDEAEKIATTSFVGYNYRDTQDSLTHRRLSISYLSNIIEAEKKVCYELEHLFNKNFKDTHSYWIENKKRLSFLAMDGYIAKAKINPKGKRMLRKQLFGFLSPASPALNDMRCKSLLKMALSYENEILLAIWLKMMRAYQKVKKLY